MSEILEDIRSRGYWEVIIRPTTFINERVSDILALHPIVERASVQLRGWDFPHIDRKNQQPIIQLDWVGEETYWEHFLEVWRIYKSGQFLDLCGLWDDWRDKSAWLGPAPSNWQPGQRLGIGETLFRFTEIFEFAARLSMTPVGDESMHVSVTLKNLAGRVLYVDEPRRGSIHSTRKATIKDFPFTIDISRAELVAGSREFALRSAIELYKMFGWEGSPEVLRGWQTELGRWAAKS